MSKIFYFRQNNKEKWRDIRDCFDVTLNDLLRKIACEIAGGGCNRGFEIEIREIAEKRSGQQLKAFWILIESVKRYMNGQGNKFSKEQVAEYFKIESGHFDLINEIKIGRSIANNSDCTREDMEHLINTILKFGIEHDITDCFIEDRDLKELLKHYEGKNE